MCMKPKWVLEKVFLRGPRCTSRSDKSKGQRGRQGGQPRKSLR